MVIQKMINDLREYQSDCVNEFRMNCSSHDVKTNKEAKKLAKSINRQGALIDKAIRLLMKIDA